MKTYLRYLTIAVLLISTFNSCKKDSANRNYELYIASPTKLMNMLGSNSYDIESTLSDKKGYSYTEVDDQVFNVKAIISLDATEETIPGIYYNTFLNVENFTNKIVSVEVSSIDSLSNISKEKGDSLMLLYYSQGLQPLDTTSTRNSYISLDGNVTECTIDDILNKLQNGYEANLFSITYNTTEGQLTITLWKNNGKPSYNFSFLIV